MCVNGFDPYPDEIVAGGGGEGNYQAVPAVSALSEAEAEAEAEGSLEPGSPRQAWATW